MGMLKNDKNKLLKSNKLTRGTKVTTNNTVNRLDFIEQIEKVEAPKKQPSKTIRVSIKVDNHTRNKLAAISMLGYGDSIGAIVQDLVDSKIEKLSDSELERFKFIYDTYEFMDLKKEKK